MNYSYYCFIKIRKHYVGHIYRCSMPEFANLPYVTNHGADHILIVCVRDHAIVVKNTHRCFPAPIFG